MPAPSPLRAPALLLLLLWGAGCSRGPGAEHDPRPLRLMPARGVRQVPVAVRIEGENFQPLAVRQLSGGQPLRVDRGFAAFLGDVALEQVEWVDGQTLRARVPAGLAPGLYPLRVVSPLGREVQLEGAFRVVAGPFGQLALSAEVDRAALLVGQEAQVSLSLSNPGDAPARDVVAQLLVEGPGSAVALEEGPVGELAPGASVTRRWRVQGTASGALTLRFSAVGTDAESGLALSPEAPQQALQVYTPAALVAQGALTLPQVSLGQELDATLTVLNEGGSTAQAVVPELRADGAGGVEVLQAPAAQDVPGGELRSFQWRLRAGTVGALQLSAQARGTEALSGAELHTGLAPVGTLQVHRPAVLAGALVTPGRVNVAQPFLVTLTVQNTGEAAALGVLPAEPVLTGSAGAQRLTTPGPQDVPGGAQRTFTWSYQATSPGDLTFVVEARGSDAHSGASVSTGPVTDSLVEVQTPAALGATASMSPTRVSVGQLLVLELRVHNGGQADALGVQPQLHGFSATGPLSLVSAPAAYSVPGGGDHLFRWTFSALRSGSMTLGVSAQGTDSNSGAQVGSGTVGVPAVQVQAPGALQAVLRAPVLVSEGQLFSVSLEVTHGGEAEVLDVTPSEPVLGGAGAASLAALPAPPSVSLDAGQRHTFTWQYAATRAGALRFSAGASGTDGNSGATVTAPAPTPADVSIQRPAALAAALELEPGTVNVGQLVTVSLTVQNTGEAVASAVVPQLPALEGTGSAELSAGPFPPSATVPGAEAQVFTWQYTARGAGTLTVRTGASGTEANTGAALYATPTAQALTIQRPAQLAATLAASPAQVDVGQTVTLTLRVRNAGETPALGVVPAAPVALGSSGTTLLTAPAPTPLTLAAGASHDFVWTWRAGLSGSLGFSASASGTDANTGASASTGQLSTVPLDVQQPPELVGSLVATPSPVNAGQSFALRYTVHNVGEATADAVAPDAPTPSDLSGVTLVSAPPPASLSLAGGASHTFTWEYQVDSAGSRTFTTRARGGGGNTHAALLSADASASVTVQEPAALVGTLYAPTRVSQGQAFSLTLRVQNTGQSAALGVAPLLPTLSGAASALLVGTPLPLPAYIPAGGEHTFTWQYTAGSAGPLTFTTSATGLDETSGLTLGTGTLATEPLTVQRPAALQATLSASPSSASLGQTLTVTLTVHNTGEAQATAVTPGALSLTGTGAATPLAGPTPLSTSIAGGTSRTFSWQYTASVPGTLGFSAGAQGKDANTGVTISATPATAPLVTLQRPAALTARMSTSLSAVNEGQDFSVALEVENAGEASATGVSPTAPTLYGTSTATLLSGPTPASATLAGGQVETFRWSYRAGGAGDLAFASSATGSDLHTGTAVGSPQASTPSLAVREPAALGASLAVPAQVSVGQELTLTLTVINGGDSAALDVAPSVPTLSGSAGLGLVSGPTPASATVAGGASQAFRWTYRATSAGSAVVQVGASGIDATDDLGVSAAPASASVSVTPPALLTSSLRSPAIVGLGETFSVTMTVRNDGAAAAQDVAPSVLELSGSATAALVSGPTPTTPVSLPGGQPQDFTWRYTATSEGSLALSGNATGTDANSGLPLASATSGATSSLIRRATEVASDPFGDGTSFAYVFSHHGQLHLGPNKTGSGGVRSNPDGSAPQSFSFRFAQDVTGSNTSKNASPAPYPSIGSKGCVEDTPACGPNNEAGRGLLFHGNLGGQDWLGMVGAHPSYKVTYLYLTPDADPELDFRYVDLDGNLPGTSLGFSAAHFYGTNLYVGVATTGGARPGLLAITRMPNLPGLEGNDTDVAQLELSTFPYFGSRGTPSNPATMIMIDSMAQFGGKLYLANNGGCVRSTRLAPRSYKDFPGDWANCTPNLAAYAERTSVTVSQVGELEPADRAVPKLVAFGERLYLARNTTLGPQLFACTPGATGFAADCDPGDWSLVAPNSVGDTHLTQFDLPGNTRITLLAATASHLYVGFNNASAGLVLFRTALPTASARGDFRGLLDCSADQAATTCQGLGQNGLGVGATRIFDGTALDFDGRSYLYLTAGTGTDAVRVFRIAD